MSSQGHQVYHTSTSSHTHLGHRTAADPSCPTAVRPGVHRSFGSCSCSTRPPLQCCSASGDPIQAEKTTAAARRFERFHAVSIMQLHQSQPQLHGTRLQKLSFGARSPDLKTSANSYVRMLQSLVGRYIEG